MFINLKNNHYARSHIENYTSGTDVVVVLLRNWRLALARLVDVRLDILLLITRGSRPFRIQSKTATLACLILEVFILT